MWQFRHIDSVEKMLENRPPAAGKFKTGKPKIGIKIETRLTRTLISVSVRPTSDTIVQFLKCRELLFLARKTRYYDQYRG